MKHWLFIIWLVTWTTTEGKEMYELSLSSPPIINNYPLRYCGVVEKKHEETFSDRNQAILRKQKLLMDKNNHDVMLFKMEREQ